MTAKRKPKTKASSKSKAVAKATAKKTPAKVKVKTKTKAKTKAKTQKKAPSIKKTTVIKKSTPKKVAPKKTVAKKTVAKKTVAKKAAPKAKAKTTTKPAAKKTAAIKAPAKQIKKTAKTSKPASAKISAKKVKASKAKQETATETPVAHPAPKKLNIAKMENSHSDFVPYIPEKNEDYMNDSQKEHFRQLLLDWKKQLMEEVDRTVSHMKDEAGNYPDPADRASQEEEFSLELRTRDRERKLIKKIDSTIDLIDQDDYGYCESCGIEIGVRRLEVRPTASQCIDCKTLDEIKEKQIMG